jgi:hypothetical protein
VPKEKISVRNIRTVGHISVRNIRTVGHISVRNIKTVGHILVRSIKTIRNIFLTKICKKYCALKKKRPCRQRTSAAQRVPPSWLRFFFHS